MAMTIHVDIVSAEAAIYSGNAEFVVVPAEMGEVGIYPRHTPLLTRIKPGSVRIKVPDKAQEDLIYVSGGILEVQPGVITILSDTAIRGAAQFATGRGDDAQPYRHHRIRSGPGRTCAGHRPVAGHRAAAQDPQALRPRSRETRAAGRLPFCFPAFRIINPPIGDAPSNISI